MKLTDRASRDTLSLSRLDLSILFDAVFAMPREVDLEAHIHSTLKRAASSRSRLRVMEAQQSCCKCSLRPMRFGTGDRGS